VARDGKESILSISVKAFGTPKYVQTVKAGSFNPPPKVDSAILAIENIKPFSAENNSASFMNVVKRGFASKRKLLTNNLGITGEELEKCGIARKARAEELTVEDWRNLATTYPHISGQN